MDSSGHYSSEFSKLLVHRYPLDIVAGLHVPKILWHFSKKKGFQLESATNFPPIHVQNQGDLWKKKGLHFESDTNFPNSCRKLR